jgi:hypothetical protein
MSVSGVLRAQLPALALASLLAGGLVACGSDDGSTRAADEPTPAGSGSTSGPASPSPSASEMGSGPHSGSPSETAPPGTPQCSKVWRDGASLPRTYVGCVDDTGFVKRDRLGCSSGQAIVRYDDRFYGVAGGTVHRATAPLDKNRQYLAAAMRCRA